MITDLEKQDRERVARRVHPNCVMCSPRDPLGLGLQFTTNQDGSVFVTLPRQSWLEGYPAQLHGGIIASLFDAAMVHCLFARGKTGVTASLNVRYRQPVKTIGDVEIHAHVVGGKSRLVILEGKLVQNGSMKATAKGKFMLNGR